MPRKCRVGAPADVSLGAPNLQTSPTKRMSTDRRRRNGPKPNLSIMEVTIGETMNTTIMTLHLLQYRSPRDCDNKARECRVRHQQTRNMATYLLCQEQAILVAEPTPSMPMTRSGTFPMPLSVNLPLPQPRLLRQLPQHNSPRFR